MEAAGKLASEMRRGEMGESSCDWGSRAFREARFSYIQNETRSISLRIAHPLVTHAALQLLRRPAGPTTLPARPFPPGPAFALYLRARFRRHVPCWPKCAAGAGSRPWGCASGRSCFGGYEVCIMCACEGRGRGVVSATCLLRPLLGNQARQHRASVLSSSTPRKAHARL